MMYARELPERAHSIHQRGVSDSVHWRKWTRTGDDVLVGVSFSAAGTLRSSDGSGLFLALRHESAFK